jgi:hypothetical protein
MRGGGATDHENRGWSMSVNPAVTTGGCIGLLFFATVLRADGVCTRAHPVTAAERATMTEVLQTARDALPSPPVDWVIVGNDAIATPRSFCLDRARTLSYSFGRSYGNRSPQKQQASEQATATAASAMQADLARKQPRLDALLARMNALSQQAIQAAQAGDPAKVDRVNLEMEKVSNEYTALLQQGDAAAEVESAGAESLRDIDMHIAVRVNPGSTVAPPGATSVAPPPGARAALRWTTEREGITSGHALLLIGPWKQNESGQGWSPALVPAVPSVTAAWYEIEIEADPSRIEALMRDVDSAALAATVAR